MSKIRGVFPLFLATTFGIVNGIWVFGPAFREQQEEKSEEARKSLEAPSSENNDIKILRNAEAQASRSSATKSALKPIEKSSSWWPSTSLWSKELSANSSITPSDVSPDRQRTNNLEKK